MKKLPNRERYDSPPQGYERKTTYFNVEQLKKFKAVLRKEKIKFKQGLEDAIRDYIKSNE
jgi:hypothetical protein